jgi:hypothetical protein
MYEIFIFSGGVYRFDEFKEVVEDIGGIVLKKDLFHISRGYSTLGDEVQVTLIIPLDDEKLIKSFSDEIKGHLEKLNDKDLKKIDLLTYISICDVLIKSGKWMTLYEIKNSIKCPCQAQLCQNQELDNCNLDQMDKSINKFTEKGILLKREEQGKNKYNIRGL